MTDGTSQGLFIVVAIVIFGIFTLMAYILFEDTLSPALANMFTDATEKSKDNLTQTNLVKAKDFHFLDSERIEKNLTNIKVGYNSIYYESNGNAYTDGPYIRASFLKPDKKYTLTYNITDLGDSIGYLGGHSDTYNNVKMYLDGNPIERLMEDGSQGNAYHYSQPYPKDGKTHRVRVEFDTYDVGELLNSNEIHQGLFIQPNRHYSFRIEDDAYENSKVPAYKVLIENIRLEYRN